MSKSKLGLEMAERRLDMAMVAMGLAPSRTHAQVLIRAGKVEVRENGAFKSVTKPSRLIHAALTADDIRVTSSELSQFVSRGGLKIQGALRHLQLQVGGLRVLDVGISTGGFSDCLLQAGATEVIGIDVGHGQLHPSLKSRVTLYEGVNARDLITFAPLQGQLFDLVVVDVSFISLGLVLPSLPSFLKPDGRLLALVKPQFEATSLNKKGVVKDVSEYVRLNRQVGVWCEQLHLRQLDYFSSSIEGSDGNQEFFLYAQLDSLRPSSGGMR
jgi:23S rRNA (cytidine1920-2'-O)/16S rRNA (cytidine1409-2'-O)-methyltransferase